MAKKRVKERPIIFSGAMIQAILDGRKTQTRRVIKFKPVRFPEDTPNFWPNAAAHLDGGGNWIFWSDGKYKDLAEFTKKAYPNGEGIPCPYGRPGDLLYVRESFWIEHDSDVYHERPIDCGINLREDDWARVWYCATDDGPGPEYQFYSRRPSIHMPKWASRIKLRVTAVKVERVQDITGNDCIAEGIVPRVLLGFNKSGEVAEQVDTTALRRTFSTLWDSINAKRGYSWDYNPFVWVVEFEQIEK